MARHLFASLTLVTGAVYWAAWLFIVPSPWSKESAAVIGAGVVIAATITVAGILVEHNQLAYRLGWSIVAFLLFVALMRPLGLVWMMGVAVLGIAAVSMTDRTLSGWIRSEPPVAPVPRSAVGLALILLAAPIASALVTTTAETTRLPWLALGCWTILFWYARRQPGTLALVRFGVPLMAFAGWRLPLAALVAWIVMIAAAAMLAWTSTTRLAIRPLIERGSKVMIPPEFVPEEIRRKAGIDRRE